MLCLQVTRWLKLFGFPNESSDWWLGFFWAGFFFFLRICGIENGNSL